MVMCRLSFSIQRVAFYGGASKGCQVWLHHSLHESWYLKSFTRLSADNSWHEYMCVRAFNRVLTKIIFGVSTCNFQVMWLCALRCYLHNGHALWGDCKFTKFPQRLLFYPHETYLGQIKQPKVHYGSWFSKAKLPPTWSKNWDLVYTLAV